MSRKKKNGRQNKHQQEPGEEADTSDEESQAQGYGCPHVTRAVNINNVKKAIKSNGRSEECQMCQQKTSSSNKKTDSVSVAGADDTEPELPSVWLCLQCGFQGCGRTSPSRHAILHFQKAHSDPHDLVVNPDSWSIWCYKCDDEVAVDSARRLSECVEFIKKQFNLSARKYSHGQPKAAAAVEKVPLEQQLPNENVQPKVEEQPKVTARKPINGMRIDTPTISKVKGLSNLGNTCFFNAVMQVLSQCRCFVSVLRDHSSSTRQWQVKLGPEQKINDLETVDVTLSSCGGLTDALIEFLDEMDQVSQKKNGIVNPKQLFKSICDKASQFKGFQQQDSHELLRYMLDAVKTEELRRQRLGLLQAFGIEKSKSKDVDDVTKASLKALSSLTDFTLIEKVFGGQLVSIVKCEECHVSSQVFETFMDLSLPVFEEKPSRPGLHKRTHSTDNVPEEGTVYRKTTENSKPSKHQEKKNKRQLKRESKKQSKSQKLLQPTVEEESSQGAASEASKLEGKTISEGAKGDSDGSLFPDLELYVNEADVEDNDETSSHHSQGSCKSQNESDISSLSPTDTVCASGSTTIESDLTATETIEDGNLQASEINSLCQQVAALELGSDSLPPGMGLMDASATANALTSPSSVEVTSIDSGIIIGSSTDSGIFHEGERRAHSTHQSSHHAQRKYCQELLTTSLTSLAPPCKLASQECSVLSCLHQFTIRELLMGNNKFGCENCTRRKAEKSGTKPNDKPAMVYTNASKQLLVSSPPAVLTLQLKRFQQVGRNLMKVNRYVEFPVLLDLGPFCSRLALALPHVHKGQKQIIYSLIGVVEHSGKLTGGHYTAFVKVQPQQERCYPFLNERFMGEKDLQWLLEEVRNKHDTNTSWEIYTDLGEPTAMLFHQEQYPEVPPGKWFHISDSHVTEVSEPTVLRCKAYLLFYERIV